MLERGRTTGTSPLAETAMRMRACRDAGLPVSADLLNAAIQSIEAALDTASRRRQRNDLIRRAALMMDGSMAPHTKAGALLVEAKALARASRLNGLPNSARMEPVRCRLAEAAAILELPTSKRQFYRVLISDPD